jgi:hypothetical protein
MLIEYCRTNSYASLINGTDNEDFVTTFEFLILSRRNSNYASAQDFVGDRFTL